MKKNNLIALIVVSVVVIGILLWKSGVFGKSVKKESNEEATGESGYGIYVGSGSQMVNDVVPDVVSGDTSVTVVPLPYVSTPVNGLDKIQTLNSPEMISVNYGKRKR